MSHELHIVEGEAQVMLRQDAWHQLGTIMGRNFGWLDLVAANMSITWPVEKVALSDIVDGEFNVLGGQYVAFRSEDNAIVASGIGETWASTYPEIGYEFVQYLRDEHGVGIENLESAGMIRDGRQWFMTFAAGEFEIGGFKVTSYVTVSGSYDQSWVFQVQFHQTVAVCANTITAVRAAGQMLYKFKNTTGLIDRVEEAKAAAKMQRAREEGFKQFGERLLGVRVDENAYRSFVNELFPIDDDVPTKTRNVNGNARDQVRALFTSTADANDPNVAGGVEGTGWAFMQAVNTYENWGAPIRKTKGVGTTTARALRQIDATVSGRQPLTDKAIDLVLA